MKKARFLLIALLWMLSAGPLCAQKIVLGERIPEVRSVTWLDGLHPDPAPLTAVVFFTASNPSCLKALAHLRQLQEQADDRLRVLVVTRDAAEQARAATEGMRSPRLTVALDPEGKIFKSFGVSYVPFSLLTDAHKRLLWQGNSLQLNGEILSAVR